MTFRGPYQDPRANIGIGVRILLDPNGNCSSQFRSDGLVELGRLLRLFRGSSGATGIQPSQKGGPKNPNPIQKQTSPQLDWCAG